MFSKNKAQKIWSIVFIMAILFSGVQAPVVRAQGQDGLKRQVNAQTGKVSFIAPKNGRALPAFEALGLLNRPQDPALALAQRYAPEFGIKDPQHDLTEMKSKHQDDGRLTVRYQQKYQGIPVMGGELIVNTNEKGDLYSMNGEVSPDLALQTQPTIDSAQAAQTALQALAKWYQKTPADFVVSTPELWVFDESLLQPSTRPAELVWRMEVTPKDNAMPLRELVLVNAQHGSISLHFNQVDTAWGETQKPETKLQVSELTPISSTSVNDPTTTILSSSEKIPALLATTWYVATTGNNANSCTSTGSPCLTINGAIGKAAASGDTIKVATGTYTGTGTEVVSINKSVTLSGGWNNTFTTQSGMSTIDGQNARQGIHAYSLLTLTVSLDRFIVMNGQIYGIGGGIYTNGNMTITNGYIHNNSATYDGGNSAADGGGIYNSGTLIMNKSTISSNFVTWSGGGIYNAGTLILNNATVSSNSGHGIFNYYGSVTLNNSTVTGNSSYIGGGIYNHEGTVSLRNSILGGNTATQSYPDCSGLITSYGYNLIGNKTNCAFTPNIGDLVGTNASPVYPRLTPLQDNGGLTLTHALLAGSPAIDAGDPATPGSGGNACLGTDQRGVVRPDGTRCDIGAYEGSIPWTSAPFASTYTANNTPILPGTFLCNQIQASCTSGINPQADAAHTYAIGTYNFYATNFKRDSIDNGGMTIISSVHYKTGYKNAFWDGTQMVYGDGYGFALADDVVAHELTHGVTEKESNLFYWYQSGAINESLSDVFGEYYDQTNGLGNDDSAVKWLHGEDISGRGANRDMKNPPHFGDPDKMTSTKYYKGLNDNGGVHTNSGVNNKAVYLMVDGGTFNNKIVAPIGWEKVGAIYYEVNSNLLPSGADYSDLYYAIQQACGNLIGQHGITVADCQEVKDALDAVQMNNSLGSFNPEAPLCPSDMVTDPSLTLFEDDLESGSGNFFTNGAAWTSSYGYASSGTYMYWGRDSYSTDDSKLELASGVLIPEGKTFLHFKHAYLFDYFNYQGTNYYFDGGVLEYSTNGGSANGDAIWKDAKTLFSAGKKYGPALFKYSGNPLGGRPAFVGDSHGYISSRYNLSSLAGQTVNFRWRLGTDQSVAFLGWFIDDVQVYTCVPIPAVPVLVAPAQGALVKDYTPILEWSDTFTGLDHYQIQVADNSAFTAPVYDDNSLIASYFEVPSDLTPNITYYWRVRSFNSLGDTKSWTVARSFRTVIVPPTLTAPVDTASLDNRRPLFNWDDVAGATGGYQFVLSKQANLGNPLKNIPVVASEYLPPDLPANTLFYWRVMAKGPNGPSAWSDTHSFTTGNPASTPVLVAPANNALVKDYTPLLDWKNSVVPAGTTFKRYELQVDDNNDFSSLEINIVTTDGILTESSFTPPSDLTPNTKYFWRVRSVNLVSGVEHFSGWSKVWAFRAVMLAPTLLTPLDTTTVGSLKPALDWDDVAGASSYTIQIATSSSFGTIVLTKNSSTSDFTLVTNLLKNKTFYWRVRALGPNGPSDWSVPFSFHTPQ